MWREAKIVFSGAVNPQGGGNSGVGEFFMQSRDVFAGMKKGSDTSAVGHIDFGADNGEAALLQFGDKPRTFAVEFGGDVVDSYFQGQFHGGNQAGDGDQSMRT